MRIGICGTQSVGKSTLVKALKKEECFKNYHFFTERSKELQKMNIPLNKESTFKGQVVFMLERISELTNENMITDRTLLDVLSFTLSSNLISQEDKKILMEYTKKIVKSYDLIIYIPINLPMVNNGIRETDENFREIIDIKIKSILNVFNIKYKTLKSLTIIDRVEEIKKYIK